MSRLLRSVLAIGLSLGILSAVIGWQGVADPPSVEKIPSVNSGPSYWKGNLHTHSLWSDGDDFPEMIADWYKQHGYQFLTLSDHNILSEGERWLNVTKDREEIVQKYRKRFGDT